METLGQDLRYAFRSLRRSKGFSVIAMLTLALGIGATTAVFSVVNGVLLKPLPYPDADRVTYVGVQWEQASMPSSSSTPLAFSYIAENARVFEGVTTYEALTAQLGDKQGWVDGIRVSEDFFTVVGTQPVLGRGFTPGESEPGGPDVAILSHNLWSNRFGADPTVLGRTIRLDDRSYMVVGIMPEDFRLVGWEDQSEVLIPLQLDPDPRDMGQNYSILARLKPGVTPERVETDLARVFEGLRAEYPDQAANRSGIGLLDYQDIYAGGLRTPLWILLGATLFVLLIACADVANLLLARATGRRREIATRAALGAGRGRIVRQLLTESLVLGVVAGAVGLLIGVWMVDALLAAAPYSIPRIEDIGLDARVLGFAVLTAVATAVVFGLASALTVLRLDLATVLRGGGRGGGDDRARRRTRDALIVAEAAVSLVLLIGAGLLITSFAKLRGVDPGFNPDDVLTVDIQRTPEGYDDAAQIWRFEQRVLERLRAIPGVTSAAATSSLPLERGWNIPLAVEGRPDATEGAMEWRAISDGYFATVETPLLRGRAFTAADMAGPPVAIINESTAERYWPEGDALGQHVVVGMMGNEMIPDFPAVPREIVGVVVDMREIGLDQPPRRTVFVPQSQVSWEPLVGLPTFMIRASDPSAVRDAVTRAIQEADPRMTELEFRTLNQVLFASIAQESFYMLLMTLFAGVALLLTALGIYGVVSYAVGQRAREIGVRIALGAGRGDVLRLVLRQGMLPVLIGLGIGLLAAFAFTRVLAGMLYGVGVRDPLTFVAVALLLAGVALCATWLPARRATRVDPMVALRAE
jgi:putative ABC transport system permease protein